MKLRTCPPQIKGMIYCQHKTIYLLNYLRVLLINSNLNSHPHFVNFTIYFEHGKLFLVAGVASITNRTHHRKLFYHIT